MVKKLTILKHITPFLFNPREKLHLNDLSKSLSINHTTLRLDLNYLEKIRVLNKELKGRLTLYSLNFENQFLIDYLTIAEKINLIEKTSNDAYLKEFIESIRLILNEKNLVILFGSAVHSFEKANDIDIVVTNNFSQKIRTLLGKKIHLINIKKLENIQLALKLEILKKHLILQGTEQVLRWLLL